MKKRSDKQKLKDAEIARIKKELIEENGYRCELSRTYSEKLDLCHILPKSIFPEFYLCKWNMFLAKREWHNEFDNRLEYRQLQIHLFTRAFEHAPVESKRYFRFNK
jgi:hypothetical protein